MTMDDKMTPLIIKVDIKTKIGSSTIFSFQLNAILRRGVYQLSHKKEEITQYYLYFII